MRALKKSVAAFALVALLASPGLTKQETYANKIERWKVLALDGDPDAAFAVAEYFVQTTPPGLPETAFWLPLAAENGHVIGMVTLASYLSQRGGALNCRRAVFWIRRARTAPDLTRYAAKRDEFIATALRSESSVWRGHKCKAFAAATDYPDLPQ